jgi:DNA-binding response OmpR family regulator
VKILLIEDDQLTSSVITSYLIAHHHTVKLAMDGEAGLELATLYEYDLILLDVMLPHLDGISVCKQLRTQGYHNPILLLTAKDSTTDRVMGLDAGADDYVVKPCNMDELMARVRALLRRGKAIPSSIIVWENIYFDPINSEVICQDKLLHLTPKEYCLLELFLLNPKRIFSRAAILEKLWDFADTPGEETVSTHIKCLRQKFKAAGSSDPIETVHGLGYKLKPPSQLQESATSVVALGSGQKPQKAYQQKIRSSTYKIWEKFKGKFLEQFAVLEQTSNLLVLGHLTPELKEEAKYQAHKLAGALGIFGLIKGSEIARELENLLEEEITIEDLPIQRISQLVKKLEVEVNKTPELEPKSDKVPYSPLILIVDDDLILAERVRIEAIAWGLRVEIATDLDVARKAITQSPPDVILLDLNFPGSTENGLTLLREVVQKTPKIPVLVFTGKGNLTDRLEVARLGGQIFLQKPLPTYEILKAVTGVLKSNKSKSSHRVMVVDDDSIALTHISTLLSPLGLEVIELNNSQDFWNVLTNTTPDLLVLDIEMPNFSGLDLCKVVRNDPQWYKLPIIFWSAHTEVSDLDQAFIAGADDYISKSTEISELITKIIRRLKRVGFQQN